MSLLDFIRGLGVRRSGRPQPEPHPVDAGEDEPEAWPIPEDAVPVHVVGDHAEVRLKDGRLSIAVDGGAPREVRLDDVASLAVHGNTAVSTPALLALMRRGAPILWHGFDGRLVGRTQGLAGEPSDLREAQYHAAADPRRALEIARAIVCAKLGNARRLLVRRRGAADVGARRMAPLVRRAGAAASLDELRGIEGAAADAYFAAWPRLISSRHDHLAFGGRSRRPPADPANAALSYLYAVLHGRCVAAAAAAGLDPMVGFLHARRAGRAALALDLMEPLRPLLADAPLIAAFNNGEFPPGAFEAGPAGGYRLTADGRRTAVRLFERRLAQPSPTPLSTRRGAYRDVVSGQARALARALRRGEAFAAFQAGR